MRGLLLICFLLLSVSWTLSAQVPPRAQRLYNEAMRYESKHVYDKAEQCMQKAIREYPGFTDAYSMLGQWLFNAHRYKAAADLFILAEKNCTNGAKLFAKATTKSLLFNGDYAQALERIPATGKDTSWKALQAQALFLQQQAAKPQDSILVTQVGEPWRINTHDAELFPFLSSDGRTFYFTRRVNGIDEDFYYAKRDTCGGWLGAKNMGSPPNTLSQESAQTISADRHYLFFMRCDNRTISGWDQGGCDLYMAYTADSVFSVPQSFGATINTPGYEGMPCLSADNRELFFVSDRAGGYGGLDIWSSRFEHGLWQAPHNLGATINTSGNETAPSIYADNQTLYFASTGHTGMGGSDLFITRKTGDTTWSAPLNLGMPINTPFDEVSMSVDAAADTAYFASDRDSLAGNFNLYQIPLPAVAKPVPISFYTGAVYDSIGRQALNYANIYISDSATGKELYQVVSNRGDGSYMIALPVAHTYTIQVSRIGYQQTADTIRCYTAAIQSPLLHNFPILPFGYEKPQTDTPIMTLYFPKNSKEISEANRIQLQAALEPWKNRHDITIMVNGYTDNSGTPMLNEQLSFTRSRSVSNAIMILGFQPGQVQPQGWGEANTAAENDTEEHRDQNRRVEIIIRK